jgi:NAD(P)-dependent dehydrogenase (short-subunit alcohol dehydrogenase family)
MAGRASSQGAVPDLTEGRGPRRVLVTGADSGIGKACAVALADEADHVAVTWHGDEDGAHRTAEEIESHGATAHLFRLDLTDPTSAPGVVDAAVAAMGGLDAVVLNAGTGIATPLLDITWEQWRDVVAVDLDGAFLCLQRSARHLVDQSSGGRIVAITSSASVVSATRRGIQRPRSQAVPWLRANSHASSQAVFKAASARYSAVSVESSTCVQ